MKGNSVTEEPEILNHFEKVCGILTDSVDQPALVVRHRLKVAACFIEEDIRRGILPEKIAGFSEVHDYVDANMYLINEGCPDPKIGSFSSGMAGALIRYVSTSILSSKRWRNG